MDERKNIVKNAYVTTKKRISHVSPIERIIKSAIPLTMSSIKEIEDTGRPIELTNKFKNISSLKNEILLLVGGVGSGKSTFIDYLTEVALHQDVKDKTVWLSVDLNKAPLSKEEIYKWLCESLMSKFKELYSDIDFEELNTLRKLYSVELRKIEKGPAALFDPSSIEYKTLIASELQNLLNNPIHSLKAFIRYMCRERGKLAVVVLDNCDRRKRDDQLLMFEVAKWMQNEFECLVVLPIRDTTFDHHRKEPPLDTVIKDLVFRIDPPLLAQVIAKRIGFALAAMSKDRGEQKGEELLNYVLPNGMRVEYPRSEQGIYLACILRSLFTDSLFRRIVTGISGRDIRRGLEIFLEFCKSGHITPDEILKIRQSQGDYTLPKHIIMRLILRGNRRYFQDAGSAVKNLFFSYPEEIVPDPFIRLEILKWLEKRYRKFGPSGIKGYHKITDLCSDMVSLGHSIDKVQNELAHLMRVGCVVSETQDPEQINEGDLVSISPSGHVHLDLVNNVDYLAACSEDVWYKNNEVADRIWKRITNQIGRGHFSHETSILNAEDLAKYLQSYRAEFISQPESYLEDGHFEKLFDISDALLNLERAKTHTNLIAEEKIIKDYPPGTIVEGEIISIQNYGIFVQFGVNVVGFIYIAKLSHLGLSIYSLEPGNRIKIKIIEYSSKHKRFNAEPVLET